MTNTTTQYVYRGTTDDVPDDSTIVWLRADVPRIYDEPYLLHADVPADSVADEEYGDYPIPAVAKGGAYYMCVPLVSYVCREAPYRGYPRELESNERLVFLSDFSSPNPCETLKVWNLPARMVSRYERPGFSWPAYAGNNNRYWPCDVVGE